MQSDSSIMQLVSHIILVDSRLYELGLQAIDVGGAGDSFFRSVSHQLYGNNNHHMQVCSADASNVSIQIVESNPGFSPITTVNPVQERIKRK